MSAGRRDMIRFAGVLPYAYDSQGTLYVLLGRERWGREAGLWSGFAGRVEPREHGAPLLTAAREAFEESSGILGTEEDLIAILPRRASLLTVGNGIHYLLPFQLNRFLPTTFAGVQAAIRACAGPSPTASHFLEKDAIAWIPTAELQSQELRTGFREDIATIVAHIPPYSPGRK